MQIKPYDGALTPGSTSPAALRPSDASLLSPKLPSVEADSVSLSNGVRSLAAALRAALPTLEAARIAELLTPRDRFVLVRALDLARAENLDARQVHALIQDLSRYRVQELRERVPALPAATLPWSPDDESARLDPRAFSAQGPNARGELATHLSWPLRTALEASRMALSASTDEALTARSATRTERAVTALTLPVFSQEDEALARSLLSTLALRDTAVDHGFVRALVDPDRAPTHAVDFSFLRRLVLSLSPAHADGAPDPAVTLARRDTRAALATAITELTLAHADLPAPSLRVLAQGRALLNARLSELAPKLALAQAEQSPLALLRSNDRALLGVLYLASKLQQREPRAVDEVAQALVALRRVERADLALVQRVLNVSVPPQALDQGALPSEAPAAAVPSPTYSVRPAQPETGTRASMLPNPQPGAAAIGEGSDEASALAARTFGSPSQLAAKAAGSYGSLAPPPPAFPGHGALPRDLGVQPLSSLLAQESLQQTQAAPQLAPALARPLDLSQALGLGAWFAQARGQARRAVRARLYLRPEAAIHAVTPARETAGEAEADDPVLDGAHKRRRIRWQLLIQRRRHTRKRNK